MVKSEFMKCPYKEAVTYTDMSNFTMDPVGEVTLLHVLHYCHHCNYCYYFLWLLLTTTTNTTTSTTTSAGCFLI